MSRIDDLIKEKCPEGVTFKPLMEVTNLTAGDRIIKSMMSDDADYPVMGGGDKPTGRYNDYNFEHSVTISRAGSAGSVNWLDSRFWATDVCFVASQKKDGPDIKFVYYYLCSQESVLKTKIYGGNLPKLNKQFLWELPIPLPPFEIQQEIVRMLDSFTELEAELEAELTKRKQQFDFYRDKLLSYDSSAVNGRQIKWLPLGDVLVSLNTGLNPRQFFRLNTDDATNYYVTIREIKGGNLYITDKTDRINDEALKLCNNRSNLEVGDVLFSGTGTIGETYVIKEEPYNWNIKEGVYSLKPISSKMLPAYLSYILRAQHIKKTYMKKAAGGTVKSVPMAEMKKLLIPVPTIQEQEEVVSCLNSFNSLTSSLVEGLPAEIEARHKQYEYYRDKLLTFKER